MAGRKDPTDLSYWTSAFGRLPLTSRTRITEGNDLRLLVDSGEFYPKILEVIRSAERTLSFEFLNMEADEGGLPIGEALIEAAERGVAVKAILDAVSQTFETNGEITVWPASLNFSRAKRQGIRRERQETRAMFRRMRGAGIELKIVGPNLKNRFTRNHRKSLIADQSRMVIGGFNPTGHNKAWHEVCALMLGPAVREAQEIFNSLYRETGSRGFELAPEQASTRVPMDGQGVTIGFALNEPRRRESIRTFLVEAVGMARHTVRIENAYFTDPRSFQALEEAARRGVKVQLIVPGASNHASVDRKRDARLPRLKEAGAEVYLYRGMTHAKLFMIDDVMVSLGSANFTPMNLRMERELNLAVLDPEGGFPGEVLERVFLRDIAASDRL
ncbi:MAG: phosphatidylserine/phosphatidylglycerophosphate/cardiolipin synthase family protein [Pseudomonadota bacterium]